MTKTSVFIISKLRYQKEVAGTLIVNNYLLLYLIYIKLHCSATNQSCLNKSAVNQTSILVGKS